MLSQNRRDELRTQIKMKFGTLSEFCRHSGVSVATLSQYLLGKAKNMIPINSHKIAKHLEGITWEELSGLPTIPPTQEKEPK